MKKILYIAVIYTITQAMERPQAPIVYQGTIVPIQFTQLVNPQLPDWFQVAFNAFYRSKNNPTVRNKVGDWVSWISDQELVDSNAALILNHILSKEPLHRLAIQTPNTHIPHYIQAVLADGAQINGSNDRGLTALHVACQAGNILVARALLEQKANPNARTSSGNTPLYLAAQSGLLELVELLLEYHADPNITTSIDATPLWIATRKLVALGQFESIATTLLLADTQPNLYPHVYKPPLHYAAYHKRPDLVRLLLLKGANPAATSRSGKTAAEYARCDTCRTMIQYRIDHQ